MSGAGIPWSPAPAVAEDREELERAADAVGVRLEAAEQVARTLASAMVIGGWQCLTRAQQREWTLSAIDLAGAFGRSEEAQR